MEENLKNKSNYAFIDSQNLNLGIRSQGWNLDYRRFRIYLRDKYGVSKAFLFIGYIPSNNNLYSYLAACGYEMVFKKTMFLKSQHIVKGNVDTELVLHAASIQFNNYKKAVIISGDGDFYCLYRFLLEERKLEKIIVPDLSHFSSLLNNLNLHIVGMNNLRKKLEKV